MTVEQRVEWEFEWETVVLGENLLQYYFVHYKSHMILSAIESAMPQCEAGH
jgi:hypothetical protein